MYNLKIKLTGLTCEACVKLVLKKIKAVDGVEAVAIDLASGQAEVQSCHPLTEQVIEQSLTGTGFSIAK